MGPSRQPGAFGRLAAAGFGGGGWGWHCLLRIPKECLRQDVIFARKAELGELGFRDYRQEGVASDVLPSPASHPYPKPTLGGSGHSRPGKSAAQTGSASAGCSPRTMLGAGRAKPNVCLLLGQRTRLEWGLIFPKPLSGCQWKAGHEARNCCWYWEVVAL